MPLHSISLTGGPNVSSPSSPMSSPSSPLSYRCPMPPSTSSASAAVPCPSSSALTHLRSPSCSPSPLPIASLALYPRAQSRPPWPCSRASWPSLVSPPPACRAAPATTSSSTTLSSPSRTPVRAGIAVLWICLPLSMVAKRCHAPVVPPGE